jgi:hypothetical protein
MATRKIQIPSQNRVAHEQLLLTYFNVLRRNFSFTPCLA